MTAPAKTHGPRTNVTKPREGKRAPRWRPELLPLVGGDPWKVLMLQQLCYWASRTHDPKGWVRKKAAELQAEIGANQVDANGKKALGVRAVRKKLAELEALGLVRSAEGWQRQKRYQVNREDERIDRVVEAERGPSSITRAKAVPPTIRNHSSECGETSNHAGESEGCAPNTEPQFRRIRNHSSDGRNHSSDGRNHSSDARTESTTESTTELPPPPRERVRPEPIQDVIVRVESETAGGGSGFMLSDGQATKLLEHAAGDVEIAVEVFVDLKSKYRNASPYQLISYARDRCAERLTAKANGGLAAKRQSGPIERLEVRDSAWSQTEAAQKFFWEPEEI